MTTQTFGEFVRQRYGVLKPKAHRPGGSACALEAWSQYKGLDWTDRPSDLRIYDVRMFNDFDWSSDALRTQYLIPMVEALDGFLDWPQPRRRYFFVAVLTRINQEILAPRIAEVSAGNLTGDLDFAHGSDLALALARALAVSLARDNAYDSDLAIARDLAVSLARDNAYDSDLTIALDLARALAVSLARDNAYDSDFAIALASALAVSLARDSAISEITIIRLCRFWIEAAIESRGALPDKSRN